MLQIGFQGSASDGVERHHPLFVPFAATATIPFLNEDVPQGETTDFRSAATRRIQQCEQCPIPTWPRILWRGRGKQIIHFIRAEHLRKVLPQFRRIHEVHDTRFDHSFQHQEAEEHFDRNEIPRN